MEEEQTTQWPKEKVQREKQRSTKYTYKTINTDGRVIMYLYRFIQ